MMKRFGSFVLGVLLLLSCTTSPAIKPSADTRSSAQAAEAGKPTRPATDQPVTTQVQAADRQQPTPATKVALPEEKIVVLPFYSIGVKESDAQGISLFFETELQKKNVYQVVEQTQIEKVLKAQEYASSAVVDESQALQTAKLLTADYVLIGTVGRIIDRFYLNAKIVAVETGLNVGSERAEASSLQLLLSLIEPLCGHLLGLGSTPNLTLLKPEADGVSQKPATGNWATNALKGNQAYDLNNYKDAYSYYWDAMDSGCEDGVIYYRIAYSSEQLFGLTDSTKEMYRKAYAALKAEYPNHRYIASAKKKAGI